MTHNRVTLNHAPRLIAGQFDIYELMLDSKLKAITVNSSKSFCITQKPSVDTSTASNSLVSNIYLLYLRLTEIKLNRSKITRI
jgi:hypothetical protein